MCTRLGNNDLIGVGIYYEICVVCHHNDLTLRLGFDKQAYQLFEHGLRIEVFLGLIDHQWAPVSIVQRVLPSSSVGEESLSPNHPATSSRF